MKRSPGPSAKPDIRTISKTASSRMETRLGELQRLCREQGIPVMIIFEGMEASGKGTQINSLARLLDPRGFNVHTLQERTADESMRPFLWRYNQKIPSKGRIEILDRSYYQELLSLRAGREKKNTWKRLSRDVCAFEKYLLDEGVVIIKIWLSISRKEQRRRFKKLEAHKSTRWRISRKDWEQNRLFERFIKAFEETLVLTDNIKAPWSIVDAADEPAAAGQITQIIIDTLEEALLRARSTKSQSKSETARPQTIPDLLIQMDMNRTIEPDLYKVKLETAQEKLRLLEHECYRRRVPVVLVFEGQDASGKGGAIRRFTRSLDPRGYRVIPVSAPDTAEKAHPYLWRFWKECPKDGHIAIFDRSWYGRVLVERVEGFCTPPDWDRAYTEINALEEHWSDHGIIICKFWLEIDKEEQARRFSEREGNPEKKWKITAEDYRNREKWNDYHKAVNEMLFRTDTSTAPWTLVEAVNKPYARIKIMETVINRLEKVL